jgi:hypothetical protein
VPLRIEDERMRTMRRMGSILVCSLVSLIVAAGGAVRDQAAPDLGDLLDRAAGYCDRLSRMVLDFICRERVEEWFLPKVNLTPALGTTLVFNSGGAREEHRYLYDFQFVRDTRGMIQERRTLLREDNTKTRVPDAPLKTHRFSHARIVMGPLGLLSRERQAGHDYRILREERIGRERAVVIEAVPKSGVLSDHLVGTIWLRTGDAGVLKIEWDPSSMSKYEGVAETAEFLRMDPRIVMASEYAFEKNGIRFPSRYTVKETYGRGGRSLQRSEVKVLYDQYKFFTVETRVDF